MIIPLEKFIQAPTRNTSIWVVCRGSSTSCCIRVCIFKNDILKLGIPSLLSTWS